MSLFKMLGEAASKITINSLPEVNLDQLLIDSQQKIELTLRNIPESEKKKIFTWMDQVRSIRNSSQTVSEKINAYERLSAPTSLKALFFASVKELLKDQGTKTSFAVHTALRGAETLASLIDLPGEKVIKLTIEKTLPKLLTLNSCESFFCDIERVLDRNTIAA